jgi:CRP-like cAMP-binding protein
LANQSTRSSGKSDGKAIPHVDAIPVGNQLLLNLPAKESHAILSKLTFVQLRTHDVLHESGGPIRFAYFPNSGLASILSVMDGGKSVEVGLTGKEGFVGLPLIVGFSTSPTQAVVQIEGSALRVGAHVLTQVLRQCPSLEKQLQRYVQNLAMQGTQVAACNRLHEVHERLGALAADVPGPDRLQ